MSLHRARRPPARCCPGRPRSSQGYPPRQAPRYPRTPRPSSPVPPDSRCASPPTPGQSPGTWPATRTCQGCAGRPPPARSPRSPCARPPGSPRIPRAPGPRGNRVDSRSAPVPRQTANRPQQRRWSGPPRSFPRQYRGEARCTPAARRHRRLDSGTSAGTPRCLSLRAARKTGSLRTPGRGFAGCSGGSRKPATAGSCGTARRIRPIGLPLPPTARSSR